MKDYYKSWTTEDLQKRLDVYQTKGHFDIAKINVSTAADVIFLFLLAIVILIPSFVGFLHFLGNKPLEEEFYLPVISLEIYPLVALIIMGLYVVGHRVDEARKYFSLKKELKSRNALPA